MPSFDVTSKMDWQELSNAIQQTLRELSTRFDFKGVENKIDADEKNKTVTLWCSSSDKFDSLADTFQNKLVKRGLSLLSFEPGKKEAAFGQSQRQVWVVQAGISKEKGKAIVAEIKSSKLKVQAQIQDEQVRVTGKKRDDLQEAISHLKQKQDQLGVPMTYGNFRD